MDKKVIIEENEEVLENSIPENLKIYLEKDESTLNKIDETLSNLDEKMNALEKEKVDSEKSFSDRLAAFEEELKKEKEKAFDEFSKRENEINEEKTRVEKIKLDEQSKQVKYIDSLKEISKTYNSKINSIEEAIKACEDNETLTKALEEEKNKLEEALNNEYDSRKIELDDVLETIGVKKAEVPEEPKFDLNLDFELPKIDTNYDLPNEDLLKPTIEESYDNEVISHESVKEVINEIYESEDIMENHVFPYLRAIRD